MVKATAFEVTGPGFTTVTLTATTVAIWPALTAAVNCVALTKVVVSGLPFQFTTEALTKPVPFTVSVNPGPPAVAELGLRLVMVGAGLMVKATAFEVTGPGFTTVTLTATTVAIWAALTWAVNCVALTKVVVSGVAFQFTTAAGSKPVPFTVRVNPGPPAVAELGLRLVIVGPGLMVKATALEVTGPGLTTVTLTGTTVAI
jgi:hypothetical protein